MSAAQTNGDSLPCLDKEASLAGCDCSGCARSDTRNGATHMSCKSRGLTLPRASVTRCAPASWKRLPSEMVKTMPKGNLDGGSVRLEVPKTSQTGS